MGETQTDTTESDTNEHNHNGLSSLTEQTFPLVSLFILFLELVWFQNMYGNTGFSPQDTELQL